MRRTAQFIAAALAAATLAACADTDQPAPRPAKQAQSSGSALAAGGTGSASGGVLSAPEPGSSKNEPVYLVHGFKYGDCETRWRALRGKLIDFGWSGPIHTVGYYYANRTARDTNCTVNLAGASNPITYNNSIEEVGRRLAWDIYNRHTREGQSVDLVGHSSGGLVMRAALTGVESGEQGFPPHLFVEDAVTLSTPHKGFDCQVTQWAQCREMRPGSDLLGRLTHNPSSAQRTDWTLIGNEDDELVGADSAVAVDEPASHKIKYLDRNDITLSHKSIRTESGNHRQWNLRYWNYYFPSDKAKQTSRGWSPLHAVGFALIHNGRCPIASC